MLLPLAALFCALALLRRRLYAKGWLRSAHPGVPVILVGNITVGGSGKTPLVIWLAQWLQQRGHSPGIISRGYGGRASAWPQPVSADSDPRQVGDEPVLLARRTGCPVWVGPRRSEAARALLNQHHCDCLIADDGLQHYALRRNLEIAVVDGERRLGNGLCLPAGPLREPPARLRQVDLVVAKGKAAPGEFPMRLRQGRVVNLADPARSQTLADFRGGPVHALAGIGNPEGFFRWLEGAGLQLIRHPFPDHHPFSPADISPPDQRPVLMTEKDGVKCRPFATDRHWVVGVEAELPPEFGQRLQQLLRGTPLGQETAGDPGVPPVQGETGLSEGREGTDLPGRPARLSDS